MTVDEIVERWSTVAAEGIRRNIARGDAWSPRDVVESALRGLLTDFVDHATDVLTDKASDLAIQGRPKEAWEVVLASVRLESLLDPPSPSHPVPLAVGQRRRWKDGRRPDAFTVTLLSNEMVTLWHETEVCPVTIVRSFVESNSEPVEGGDR